MSVGRPPEPKAAEASVAVGAVVGLATLVTMFAGLLFAYAFLRVSAGVWRTGEEAPLPRLWPLLGAASALVGSAAIWRRPKLVRAVAGATCAALVSCQALTLLEAYRAGLRPSVGPYGSVVFALTGLHAFHVAALGVLLAFCLEGSRSEGRGPHPAWGWTMNILGALWLVIYVSVYLF